MKNMTSIIGDRLRGTFT